MAYPLDRMFSIQNYSTKQTPLIATTYIFMYSYWVPIQFFVDVVDIKGLNSLNEIPIWPFWILIAVAVFDHLIILEERFLIP